MFRNTNYLRKELELNSSTKQEFLTDAKVYTLRLSTSSVESSRPLRLRLNRDDSVISSAIIQSRVNQDIQRNNIPVMDAEVIRQRRLERLDPNYFQSSNPNTELIVNRDLHANPINGLHNSNTAFLENLRSRLISDQSYVANAPLAFRDRSSVQADVVAPISAESLITNSVETNVRVFAENIRRPFGGLTPNGHGGFNLVSLEDEAKHPEIGKIADALKRIKLRLLDKNDEVSEDVKIAVSESSKKCVNSILRSVQSQRRSLDSNITAILDNPSDISNIRVHQNTAFDCFNVYEQFLEMLILDIYFVEVVAGKITLAFLAELIKRPYILQYILLVMFGVTIKFTYLEFYNDRISLLMQSLGRAVDRIINNIQEQLQRAQNFNKAKENLKNVKAQTRQSIQEIRNRVVDNSIHRPFANLMRRFPNAWPAILGGTSLVFGLIGGRYLSSSTTSITNNIPSSPTLSTPASPSGFSNVETSLVGLASSLITGILSRGGSITKIILQKK